MLSRINLFQFAIQPTNDFIVRIVLILITKNVFITDRMQCRASFANRVEFYCGVTAGPSESHTCSAVLQTIEE